MYMFLYFVQFHPTIWSGERLPNVIGLLCSRSVLTLLDQLLLAFFNDFASFKLQSKGQRQTDQSDEWRKVTA